MTSCPTCGKDAKEWGGEGARFNGHKSWCSQNTKKNGPKPTESTLKPESVATTAAPPPPSPAGSTKPLEPITFSFGEGKPLPAQAMPEFQPEGEKPKTPEATLAEQRSVGTSALASLFLPVFDLVNKAVEGGEAPGLPPDPKDLRLNKDDAETLAQNLLLVDAKHGGPLSKAFASEEGPEIALAVVCMVIGVKLFMLWRISAAKRKAAHPRSAASAYQEQEKPKSPLEKVGESLRKLTEPKPPAEPEEAKPEGAMKTEDFMKYAEKYQKQSVTP